MESATCASLDLEDAERKLMATEVYAKNHKTIPALASISSRDMPFNGTYCKDFNEHFTVNSDWAFKESAQANGDKRNVR